MTIVEVDIIGHFNIKLDVDGDYPEDYKKAFDKIKDKITIDNLTYWENDF